mgnify:CR=1 FL=1
MKSVSSQPFISVIIPTYNRADLLSQSLESLVGQSLPKDQFEVIVIDDGSSDNTSDVCRNFSQRLPLRYYRQKNSGISAAKNMGVFASCGPILLFFDDDDVADPDLLTEHIRTHSLHPEENIAVLGYTTWHPSLKISRVMDFVTNIGHFLFSYSNLKDGQELDFTYFWGGRSSCKKSLLVRHGVFNQLFRFGSEDIELGYRLSKLGLKVIYNRSAKSFMIRPLTYEQFCQRCVKQGKSQYHFSKMHPDPVIQKYCMVDDVDQKWAFVRQTLESNMARVRDIERALENSMPPADEKQLLDELGKLYWWTFTALKIKGVIEAKESDTVRQSGIDDHKDLPIPVNDIEIIRGRWRKAPPKSFERGNILIIDPFLPMYDRASGSLRLFEIMKALIRLGFQLTYIARNGEHAGVYVPLLQNMGVEVYAGDPTALQALGLDIIAPYLDVEKILRSKSFDYVILSFWHIAEYYLHMVIRNCPHSQVIIDTVDIHFLREFREAEMKKNQALLEIARRNKKRELAAYRKGDRLWVVTEEDKKAIENFVQAPIDIVPNIHKKVFWTKHYDHTSDLLFVGNFSHKPNIDAVLFFHKEVLPLIRKHMPGVKTYIVGNNPPEQIQRLNSDQFVVTGYVDQAHSEIDPMKTVYEVISGGQNEVPVGNRLVNARAYAARFNFTGADQEKKCGVLSGGERNRLHLALTLKSGANVLLLDEPLSNLDAVLRKRMRLELREIQQRLGITTVFVTHDQDEAFEMSDRVVLMNQGQIEQLGSPEEMYDLPATRFAAEFDRYVSTVAGRYRGRMVGWDVVNEAVSEDGDGLRDCVYARQLGPEAWIVRAFEQARAADPDARAPGTPDRRARALLACALPEVPPALADLAAPLFARAEVRKGASLVRQGDVWRHAILVERGAPHRILGAAAVGQDIEIHQMAIAMASVVGSFPRTTMMAAIFRLAAVLMTWGLVNPVSKRLPALAKAITSLIKSAPKAVCTSMSSFSSPTTTWASNISLTSLSFKKNSFVSC